MAAQGNPVMPLDLAAQELQNQTILRDLDALSIPAVIQQRTRELYSPAKDDQGRVIIGKDGKPISLDNQINEGRNNFFQNQFGSRDSAVQEILDRFKVVNEDGTFHYDKLAADYNPRTKKFKTALNTNFMDDTFGVLNSALAGITPDDLIKAASKDLNIQRQDNPAYKKAARVANVTELTDEVKISSIVANQQEKDRLLRTINSTPKGAALLNKYLTSINAKLKEGQKPLTAQALTNNQLQNVATQADNLKEENVLGRKLQGAQIKQVEQATESAKESTRLEGERLGLDRTIHRDNTRIADEGLDIQRTGMNNELALAEERIALERAQLDGANTRQQELLNHQTAISNKNVDLQMALAQFNREDRAEDRAYDRERDTRDRRQALMLMLMQGLGNLGKSFGAGL